MRQLLLRLRHDQTGAMLVEFALIAPAFLIMLIGIFQAAVQLQAYNALRSLSSDSARWITVQYQNSNGLTDEQIRTGVMSLAQTSRYMLKHDRVDVEIARPTSRIAGTTEIEVEIQYQPPNWLGLADLPILDLSYTRPVFVVEPT